MNTNRITLAQAGGMTVIEIANLDIDLIAGLLEDVAELVAQSKKLNELMNSAMHERFNSVATAVRKAKGVDTGTVRIIEGAYTVIADLPKKIDWDQNGLQQLEAKLAEMGEPTSDYIKLKRDISEAAYKAWPSSLQKMFEPHRTMATGKPTYKLVNKDAK